jgi:hypothetical protein
MKINQKNTDKLQNKIKKSIVGSVSDSNILNWQNCHESLLWYNWNRYFLSTKLLISMNTDVHFFNFLRLEVQCTFVFLNYSDVIAEIFTDQVTLQYYKFIDYAIYSK